MTVLMKPLRDDCMGSGTCLWNEESRIETESLAMG